MSTEHQYKANLALLVDGIRVSEHFCDARIIFKMLKKTAKIIIKNFFKKSLKRAVRAV
jgi:hypothetical protein